MVASNTLPPGHVFDAKWRLESVLGEGGMGVVYAASHIRNANRVAVKVLHADVCRDASARERFLHEGYAANRVQHPGVVRVLDDGTTAEGHVYLVMERLEGRSLEAVAEASGGFLAVHDAVRFALPLLEVMAAAHTAGIIHRDLKPENVFLCNDGAVKVLDFGLARVREAASQKRLTTTGVPLGTPAFMPAEQALAHWDQVDARSDVYALGASLFTLITGQLVHDGRTVPELIVAVSTRPARPIRSVAPHVPVAIAAVIDRALGFRPADRFPSAVEMLAALRSAVANESAAVHSRATLQSAPGGVFDASATIPQLTPPSGFAPSQPLAAAVSVVSAPGAFRQASPVVGDTLAAGQARRTESAVSSGARRSAKSSAGAIVGLVVLIGVGVGAGVFFLSKQKEVERQPQSSSLDAAVDTREAQAPGSATAHASPSVVPAAPPSVVAAPSAAGSAASSGSGLVTASAAASQKPLRPRPPPATATPPKPCKVDPFTARCVPQK